MILFSTSAIFKLYDQILGKLKLRDNDNTTSSNSRTFMCTILLKHCSLNLLIFIAILTVNLSCWVGAHLSI